MTLKELIKRLKEIQANYPEDFNPPVETYDVEYGWEIIDQVYVKKSETYDVLRIR